MFDGSRKTLSSNKSVIELAQSLCFSLPEGSERWRQSAQGHRPHRPKLHAHLTRFKVRPPSPPRSQPLCAQNAEARDSAASTTNNAIWAMAIKRPTETGTTCIPMSRTLWASTRLKLDKTCEHTRNAEGLRKPTFTMVLKSSHFRCCWFFPFRCKATQRDFGLLGD